MEYPIEQFVSAERLAKFFDVEVQTVTRWWQTRAMPPPVRMGRRILRWRVEEIQKWLADGCPEQPDAKLPGPFIMRPGKKRRAVSSK